MSSCRITVLETIYHQDHDGGQPAQPCEARWTRWLESGEQPYQRTKVGVGAEWQRLDLGWVKDLGIGMLVVENLAGSDMRVMPTEEQAKDTAAKALEIAGEQDIGLILVVKPGETVRFEPNEKNVLWIRCRSGETKYKVTAFPR